MYINIVQIPGVLPVELRNCTPLELRMASPAAVIMQIYCVWGTGSLTCNHVNTDVQIHNVITA